MLLSGCSYLALDCIQLCELNCDWVIHINCCVVAYKGVSQRYESEDVQEEEDCIHYYVVKNHV